MLFHDRDDSRPPLLIERQASATVRPWVAALGLILTLPALGFALVESYYGFALGLLGAALVYYRLRHRLHPLTPAPMRLTADGLEVPEEDETVVLRRDQIDSIYVIPGQALVIETPDSQFVWPLSSFKTVGDVDRLLQDLQPAAATTSEHRAALEENLAALQRRTPVTTMLLVSIGLVYVIEYSLGAGDLFGDPLRLFASQVSLLRLGANSPYLVAHGQWYRLFAANFLHGNMLHLYINAFALANLGTVLERLIGSLRYLVLFLVSALAGSLLSCAVSQAPFSVGASTALFGLVGGLGILHWRYGATLAGGIHLTRRWWTTLILLNLGLPLLIPAIDVFAHIGGCLGGAMTMWMMYDGKPRLDVTAPPSAAVRSAAVVLVLSFLAGLVLAVQHATDRNIGFRREALMAIVHSGAPDPWLLNLAAWAVATDKNPTPEELEAAADAARAALNDSPADRGIIDTLATVRYRQHAFDDAISLELDAIRLESKANYWTQLARFVRATHPPVVLGPDPGLHTEVRGQSLVLSLDRLGTCLIVGDLGPQIAAIMLTPDHREAILSGTNFTPLLLDTSTAHAFALPRVSIFKHDPEIDQLP